MTDASDLQSLRISDELLLELGRIAWLAINLEDWANSTCELILGDFGTKQSITPRITDAIKEVDSWGSGSQESAAREWLALASDQVARRNHILHSTPVEDVSTGKSALVHFPRNGEAPVTTPLDLVTLQAFSGDLRSTLSQWREIHLTVNTLKRARRSASADEFPLFEREVSDDDPEVVEGMERLRELRAAEKDIPEI